MPNENVGFGPGLNVPFEVRIAAMRGAFPLEQYPVAFEWLRARKGTWKRKLAEAARDGLMDAIRDAYANQWAEAHGRDPGIWTLQEKPKHVELFTKLANLLLEYQIFLPHYLAFAYQYYTRSGRLKYPTPANLISQNVIDAYLARNPYYKPREEAVDLALAEQNTVEALRTSLTRPSSWDTSPLGMMGVDWSQIHFPPPKSTATAS